MDKTNNSPILGAGSMSNGEVSDEAIFEQAMEQYKKSNKRSFPTWSEVLEVARSLGYRKIIPRRPLPRFTKKSAKSS